MSLAESETVSRGRVLDLRKTFMHNVLLTARSSSILLIVPLVIAVSLAPGMRSAISTSAMSDRSAFCVGFSCQVNGPAEGRLLHQLIQNSIPAYIAVGISKIAATTPISMTISSIEVKTASAVAHWAAQLCASSRVLLCDLTRGFLHLGFLLLSGLSGTTTPTRLDLGLVATLDPHFRGAQGCPGLPNKSTIQLRPGTIAST